MSDPAVESIKQHFDDLEEQGIHPRPRNAVLERLEAEEKRKIQPPPPWLGHDFPVFDAPMETVIQMRLSSLLKEQPVVSVDEAARLTGLTADEIEDYTRQHPDHVLWFGGPAPSIARSVVPEKPDGGKGAQEIPHLP